MEEGEIGREKSSRAKSKGTDEHRENKFVLGRRSFLFGDDHGCGASLYRYDGRMLQRRDERSRRNSDRSLAWLHYDKFVQSTSRINSLSRPAEGSLNGKGERNERGSSGKLAAADRGELKRSG